jgi:hypothetical protein
MSDADFITVFNVADTGYRNWWLPAFGLIFIAVGTQLPKLFAAGVFPNHQKRMMASWFPAAFVGFAVIWTIMAFLGTFVGYWHGREKLLSGKAQYVEGTVQDFVPMPYQGHAEESFTVNGVGFRYSDYVVGAGFNLTASHGGPIREGLHVRIWYSGNDILKLQVPKGAALASTKDLPVTARPPVVRPPMFMVFWVALALGSWFLIGRLPTPQAKKLWSDRIAILAGILFFLFFTTQFATSKNSFSFFLFGPVIALITWLNVRNTYYCGQCGKRSLDRNWFGGTYHCPYCGHKLK